MHRCDIKLYTFEPDHRNTHDVHGSIRASNLVFFSTTLLHIELLLAAVRSFKAQTQAVPPNHTRPYSARGDPSPSNHSKAISEGVQRLPIRTAQAAPFPIPHLQGAGFKHWFRANFGPPQSDEAKRPSDSSNV